MKPHITSLLTIVATATLSTAGSVWAANQPMQQTPPDKDFAKLSADGTQAFQDLTLTRIAIFDGNIDQAKKFINDANSEFGKAKTDDAVFMKAEDELKSPHNSANKSAEHKAVIGSTAKPQSSDQMMKPIAWLPVDGAITIAEDYSMNPTKVAAVADANKSLKNGDHKAAMEKLKLAGVDVAVTVAVVPLQKTLDEVNQAVGLINEGKYYEGSQLVRQIQNGERFDVADVSGSPKDPSMNNSISGTAPTTHQSSSSQETTPTLNH